MHEREKDRIRKRVPGILEALKKKQYDAHFFETAAEATQFISGRIALMNQWGWAAR